MADSPLWRLGAADIASLIAKGEISARDAVGASVKRMREVNPHLNAVVDDLSHEAMAVAATLDEKQGRGEPLGPLHGVPVTIKVNVDQEGRATTNGVCAFSDVIAPGDAPLVKSLKAAGAVVIGRTNAPEFSFRADTDNALYGRTKNPWSEEISAGGSSGGAGSAVMAGIGALAHGNDIGGSLRFPSAANGAATVKPGLGRVPAWNSSQKVERGLLAQSMSVQGLIARQVKDVRLGMKTIIAPDLHDPFHIALPFEGKQPEGRIRVAFTKETFGFDLHPDVERALDTAATALEDAGYEVVEKNAPLVEEMANTGYRALLGETEALLGPIIRKTGSETIQKIFDTYHQLFPPFEGVELLEAMAKRTYYARAWALFQEEYPLVLTPFLPQPFFAPDRDTEGVEGVREVLGAAIWSYSMNFIGLPAGNIPAYHNGVQPIPVQIIGPRFREDLILDACEAVENRAGVMSEILFNQGIAGM